MNDFEYARGRSKVTFEKLVELNNQGLRKVLDNVENGSEVNALCVSSMTFDSVLTEAINGLEHYEMRCLWEISKSLKKGLHVHFFSKRGVDEIALEHFFQVFNFSENERRRVSLYSVESLLGTSDLPHDLSDYILNDPIVRNKFSDLSNLKNSYLECFVLTSKEFKISTTFNLPTFWAHKNVSYLKTKSGNRKLVEGITRLPNGFRDLYSIDQVVSSLMSLCAKSECRKFVIKLNDGVSGDGNGFINIPNGKITRDKIRNALISATFVSSKMNYTKFFKEFARLGGIVEEFIFSPNKASPSVQIYLNPSGTYEILSSHEQILDTSGARFLGAKFPASDFHRNEIINESKKVAKVLIDQKIYGIVGLDFLTTLKDGKVLTYLIEINLRKGGTTHPYWTAKAALGGAKVCSKSGAFLLKDGSKRIYQSNDNLVVSDMSKLRSLKKLFEDCNSSRIVFSAETNSGVIFHMANCFEPYGKIGVTIIGETNKEIREMHEIVVKTIC